MTYAGLLIINNYYRILKGVSQTSNAMDVVICGSLDITVGYILSYQKKLLGEE